jgi:hypothetical protein
MSRIWTLVLLSVAAASGCGDLCLNGNQQQSLVCNASGSATFTSDADGLSSPETVVTSGSCILADGACPGFDFLVTRAGAADMSAATGTGGTVIVSMSKTLRGHVTLPSPTVFIPDAERSVPGTTYLEQLSLVDGSLDVDAPDDDHFTLAFTIHLRNSANERFTVAGGQAHIDCEQQTECSVPSS